MNLISDEQIQVFAVKLGMVLAPILLSIAAAIGATFWKICRWIAPHVERVVSAHVAFLDKVGGAIAAQTPKIDEVHGMVSDLHAQATHAA